MGGHGHRNMFYATGLPGWVRFGRSPGWGGLPPAAQYLHDTGQSDAFLQTLPEQAAYGRTYGFPFPGSSGAEDLKVLTAQKESLERSLDELSREIEELEERETE